MHRSGTHDWTSFSVAETGQAVSSVTGIKARCTYSDLFTRKGREQPIFTFYTLQPDWFQEMICGLT